MEEQRCIDKASRLDRVDLYVMETTVLTTMLSVIQITITMITIPTPIIHVEFVFVTQSTNRSSFVRSILYILASCEIDNAV